MQSKIEGFGSNLLTFPNIAIFLLWSYYLRRQLVLLNWNTWLIIVIASTCGHHASVSFPAAKWPSLVSMHTKLIAYSWGFAILSTILRWGSVVYCYFGVLQLLRYFFNPNPPKKQTSLSALCIFVGLFSHLDFLELCPFSLFHIARDTLNWRYTNCHAIQIPTCFGQEAVVDFLKATIHVLCDPR